MTVPSSPVVLPLALVAGALVLTVAACGGSTGQTPGASSPTGPGSVSASGAAGPAGSTAPASTGGPSTATPSSTASGAAGGDGCAVASLRLRYADVVGSAGAGSVSGTFTFTNTGAATCTLRGFPGVSYVGGGDGTQVGQAATRTDDGVKTRTLAPGKSVTAALRRSQPGSYGPECQETKVDGFRVFPPGSTESAFVAFTAIGCTSTSAPLLQIGPVR